MLLRHPSVSTKTLVQDRLSLAIGSLICIKQKAPKTALRFYGFNARQPLSSGDLKGLIKRTKWTASVFNYLGVCITVGPGEAHSSCKGILHLSKLPLEFSHNLPQAKLKMCRGHYDLTLTDHDPSTIHLWSNVLFCCSHQVEWFSSFHHMHSNNMFMLYRHKMA